MSAEGFEVRILSGDLAGRSFALDRPRMTVGRGPDCDIVLPSPSVSRMHAEILADAGGALVRDLGSHNGIRIDGQRVEEARIPPGGVFSIGGMRIQIAPAGGPPPPPAAPAGESLPAVVAPAAPAAPVPAPGGQVLTPEEIFSRVAGTQPREAAAEASPAGASPRASVAPPLRSRLGPLAAACALAAAAWLVIRSAPEPPPFRQEANVAVGEEKIVWWKGDLDYRTRSAEIGGGRKVDLVPVENQSLAIVAREGVPAILRVIGLRRGDTRAVFSVGGRTVGFLEVHVSGEAPPLFDRSTFAGWDDARKEAEARALYTGAGGLLDGGKAYLAWKQYSMAAFMTKEINPRPEVHASAREKAAEAEKELARQLAPWETKAFDAARRGNWGGLADACDALKMIVPDPTDVRYQKYNILGLYAKSRRVEEQKEKP